MELDGWSQFQMHWRIQKWRRARSESSSNQSRKKLEEIKQKSESAVDLAAVNGDSVEETADNQGQSAVEQLASEIVAIKEESDEWMNK